MKNSEQQRHRVIVSLGSNAEAERMLGLAEELLSKVMEVEGCSQRLWTEACGMPQEAPEWVSNRFLNMILAGYTQYSAEELQQSFKSIELRMGRHEHEKRQGVVRIDIDLLAYDNLRLHPDDWQRDYVKRLTAPFVDN